MNSKPISIGGGEFPQVYDPLQLRKTDYFFSGNDDKDIYNRLFGPTGLPMKRKSQMVIF